MDPTAHACLVLDDVLGELIWGGVGGDYTVIKKTSISGYAIWETRLSMMVVVSVVIPHARPMSVFVFIPVSFIVITLIIITVVAIVIATIGW